MITFEIESHFMTRQKAGLLLFLIYFLSSSVLKGQITISDNDSLNIYHKTQDWKGFNRKLNRILKAIPLDSFDAEYHAEIFCWIERLQKSGATKRVLRSAYMYLGSRFEKETDYNSAKECYLKAHNLVEDPFCLDELSWYIENPLMNIYNRQDDLTACFYYAALLENSLIHYNKKEELSRLYTNLGMIYRTLGNESKEEFYLKSGLSIANTLHYLQGRVCNYNELADFYIRKNILRLAGFYLDSARFVIDSSPSNKLAENQHIFHRNNIRYFAKKAKWVEATHFISLASAYFTDTSSREYAKFCNELAVLSLKNEDTTKSKFYIQKGLAALLPGFNLLEEKPEADQLFRENTLAELFLTSSDYYTYKYQLDQKVDFLKLSLAYLELGLFGYEIIQGKVQGDEAKLKLISKNRELVDRGIRQLWLIHQSDPHMPLFIEKVRLFYNYSKALLVKEKNLQIRTFTHLSQHEKIVLKQIGDLELKLKENLGLPGFEADFVLSRLYKLNQQRQTILARHSVKPRSLKYPDHYIEYHVQDSGVFALFQLDSVTRFLRLGDKQQSDRIHTSIVKMFSETEKSPDATVLVDAYRFLFNDYTGKLPDNLTIIPDGKIQFIPFDALMDINRYYLIDRTTIWYANRYGDMQQNLNVAYKKYFLYAVCPRYPEAKSDIFLASRGNNYHLKYTYKEVKDLIEVFGTSVVIDTLSAPFQVLDQMQDYGIVHYAGHAKIDSNDAYLVFPGAGNRIQLDHLTTLTNPCQMVVLSACETGLGEWEYGEGIRSMGKSFMESGARSVVMSLWSVNDESSAMIMKQYYQALKEGKSKDDALRIAKLYYRQQAGFEKQHPYYWAGFIGYGDTGKITYSVWNANLTQWILLLLLFLLFIFLNYYKS